MPTRGVDRPAEFFEELATQENLILVLCGSLDGTDRRASFGFAQHQDARGLNPEVNLWSAGNERIRMGEPLPQPTSYRPSDLKREPQDPKEGFR